jgi:hypothetical protein
MINDIYTIYRADYNPIAAYKEQNPLDVNFDQGNIQLHNDEPITSNGKYQRIVHRSIDHLYYRDFYGNTKASFGSGNINKQFRLLEDQAYVISIPQSKFGEAIMTDSVVVDADCYMIPVSGAYSGSMINTSWTLKDDSLGNLYISGSSFYSPYGKFIGGAATNYTTSIDRALVGEWPSELVYRYVNAGRVSFTSSFNPGLWSMESNYQNVESAYQSGSTPQLSEKDFLGAAWHFTASLSSSILIKPNAVSEYNHAYNFENSPFAISMVIIPSKMPQHVSGSMLISKQGPVEDLRIDENGNVFTQPIPNRSPYRLYVTSGSNKIAFEKDTGSELFYLTSSATIEQDKMYHVAVSKTGSLVTLHVNSAYSCSINSGSYTFLEKEASNLSNIYVGNSYQMDRGFNGIIDNVKLYREALNNTEVDVLFHTAGVGNLLMGNVFYNHGMMVLGAIPSKFCSITNVDCRGTHTIWETEISCTVGPGEFGMSCNPTLQYYNAAHNQYEYKPFVTGSSFKPFVTSIGLYDDYGRMVAIAKLNTPIQTPDNVDTTFVIRLDR